MNLCSLSRNQRDLTCYQCVLPSAVRCGNLLEAELHKNKDQNVDVTECFIEHHLCREIKTAEY